jgi:hypothetical protein
MRGHPPAGREASFVDDPLPDTLADFVALTSIDLDGAELQRPRSPHQADVVMREAAELVPSTAEPNGLRHRVQLVRRVREHVAHDH